MVKSRNWLHVSVVLFCYLFHLASTIDCESCGQECVQTCGTKKFRNCCYNYIKKRSEPVSSGSGVLFELMMIVPELPRYYSAFKGTVGPYGKRHFLQNQPRQRMAGGRK